MERKSKESLTTLNERIKRIRQAPGDPKYIEDFNRLKIEDERIEREREEKKKGERKIARPDSTEATP